MTMTSYCTLGSRFSEVWLLLFFLSLHVQGSRHFIFLSVKEHLGNDCLEILRHPWLDCVLSFQEAVPSHIAIGRRTQLEAIFCSGNIYPGLLISSFPQSLLLQAQWVIQALVSEYFVATHSQVIVYCLLCLSYLTKYYHASMWHSCAPPSLSCVGWGQRKRWKLSKEWGGKDLGLFSCL